MTPPPGGGASADEALDQLLRQIITGFFVLTDGQGALSKWSEPAEYLFGPAADDVLGEPFFGRLVTPSALPTEADAWRGFLERGERPGARGRCTVPAKRPDGGTFPLETVFIPVKLDEGFDFSLFLEDLSFELPLDMMLMRMRQQHPVVIKALRAALADEHQPWEQLRTAGTLIAFRPLAETPWMEDAIRRREEEAAAAEEEVQSRIAMYEAPQVQGTDVFDLEDARAVIDRLKWATDRIEDLEERSRIMEGAAQQAADAQVRAEAAERAALDAKAELAGAIADRPADSSSEAERLELLTRVERVERAASDVERERARAVAAQAQHADVLERLARLEEHARTAADVPRAAAEAAAAHAQASVDQARAELAARMDALAQSRGAGDQDAAVAARAELLRRVEALEQARADETAAVQRQLADVTARADAVSAVQAELERLRQSTAGSSGVRDEIDFLRAAADEAAAVRGDLEQLRVATAADAADIAALRGEVERLRARPDDDAAVRSFLEHVAVLRTELDDLRSAVAESDGLRAEVHALRARLEASAEALEQVEALRAASDADGLREELAALQERTAAAEAVLRQGEAREASAAEELHSALRRVEQLAAAAAAQSAELREDAGRLRERFDELSENDRRVRQDFEALRHEQDEIRAALEQARAEREQARADGHETREQLRAAIRGTEEARAALEREAREAPQREAAAAAQASESRVGVFIDGTQHAIYELRQQADAARRRLDELAAEAQEAVRRAEEARAEAHAARAEAGEVRDETRDAHAAAREAGERVDLVDRGAADVVGEVQAQKALVEEAIELARIARHEAGEGRAATEQVRDLVTRLEQAAATDASRLSGEIAALREVAGQDPELRAAVGALQADVDAVGALRSELEGLREQLGVDELREGLESVRAELRDGFAPVEALRGELDAVREAVAPVEELRADIASLREAAEPLRALEAEVAQLRSAASKDTIEAICAEFTAAGVAMLGEEVETLRDAVGTAVHGSADATVLEALSARLDALEATEAVAPEVLEAQLESLREGVSGTLGRLESLAVDLGAVRAESGATRTAVEQRLADAAAQLMASRTEAESARRGLEALREEMSALRDYAAAARTEANAAKEAAAAARKAAAADDRTIEELRVEVRAALATMQDYKQGFEDSRQAAIAARREAEAARAAADRVGAANEKTTEKVTEAWKEMLMAGVRSGERATPRSSVSRVSVPAKAAAPERPVRAGFDDDTRPLAVLDLKGRFKELNPAFTKLVGYREHEFGKATWPSVLDRATYKDQVTELHALISGDLDVAAVQSTYMHGQGLMVPVVGQIRLLRDDAGEPSGLLLTAEPAGPQHG